MTDVSCQPIDKNTDIVTGHYVVADNDTRTHTTAFFDGDDWWLPGSTMPFEPESFGTEGRFTVVAVIKMPPAVYGHWEVSNGRFR